jgi:hypothetical protein
MPTSLPRKSNVIPDSLVSEIPIDHLKQFPEVFENSRYCFSSFEGAFRFGKRVVERLGFCIRIKTTGMNQNDGIIYKYVCCQRQGLPENTRRRRSVRCLCQWGCKIFGQVVERTKSSKAHPCEEHARFFHAGSSKKYQLQEKPTNGGRARKTCFKSTSMVWTWDTSDVCMEHNHKLSTESESLSGASSKKFALPHARLDQEASTKNFKSSMSIESLLSMNHDPR